MPGHRVLLCGAGYFGRYQLEAWLTLQAEGRVQAIAVCDPNIGAIDVARELMARRTDNLLFTDAAAALAEFQPTVVDVATRPEGRPELCQLAADSGLPVICQKPLADHYWAAKRQVQAITSRGGRLLVHENFRFQPWYREARRQWESGAIGSRLHGIHIVTRTGDGWGPEAYLARQPYFRRMPRFLVHEMGVHFLDTFRYLADSPPVAVTATMRRLNPDISGEDTAEIWVRFEDGAVATWSANRFNEAPERAQAYPRYTFGATILEADGGTISVDHDGSVTVTPMGRPEARVPFVPSKTGFAGDCVTAFQRHALDCLDSNQEAETEGARYLKSVALVEAAYRSHELRREVLISEITGGNGGDFGS